MTQPPNPSGYYDPNSQPQGGGYGGYPPQQPGPQNPGGYQQGGYQQGGYDPGYQQQQPGGYQQQPGGYQQQPGGYPPQGGYPPPAPAPAPPGYASADEKNWALIAHFGGAVGALFGGVLAVVAPLVAYLVKGKESPTVRAHSLAALNFQIVVSGVAVILLFLRACAAVMPSGLELLLGVLLSLAQFAVAVGGIVFGIIAGLKANEGVLYKYPLPWTFIK